MHAPALLLHTHNETQAPITSTTVTLDFLLYQTGGDDLQGRYACNNAKTTSGRTVDPQRPNILFVLRQRRHTERKCFYSVPHTGMMPTCIVNQH